MSIVRRLGKADLFVTFTANPRWPEVLEATNGKPRFDVVSRVFACKLAELRRDENCSCCHGLHVLRLFAVK